MGETGISIFDKIKMGILSESEYDGKGPNEEIPLTKKEIDKKKEGEKDVIYDRFVSELNTMFNKYHIKTCISKMYFLAQSYAETDRFRRTLEINDGTYNEGNKISGPLYKGRGFIHINKAVSSIRQPIESFFNWLNEKTQIQYAGKVRSSKGLFVHIFGKIATALLFENLF